MNGKNNAYDVIQRSKLQKEADSILGKIAMKMMNNPEMKGRMVDMMGSVVRAWAGRNIFKRMMTAPMVKCMSLCMDKRDKNPWEMNFIQRTISNVTPSFLKKKKKKQDLSIAADLGKFMVLYWKIQADKNKENPMAFADKAVANIRSFMDNTDFSEWKTMFETSKEGTIAASKAINDVIMEYPGKLVSFAAALPTMISIAVNSLKGMLTQQLDMPPDVVYEIAKGIMGKVNGKEIGEFLNLQFEVSRRQSIGSKLAGDGVNPAIELIVADKLKEIIAEINPDTWAKMKVGKAEGSAAVKNGVTDVMKQYPDFAKKMFTVKASEKTIEMRAAKKRLKVLEDMTSDDLASVATEGADKLDTLEMADVFTSFFNIVNSIHESKPEVIPNVISSVATSIDINGLETAANGVVKDTIEAVKPAVSVFMPTIINSICDLLTAEPGQNASELDEAVDRLRGILGGGK